MDEARGVFTVADGIGSRPGGDVAAEIVVEVLPRLVRRRVTAALEEGVESAKIALRDAVVDLGEHMRERAVGRPGLSGMGATMVAVVLVNELGLVANMGDSRAYLLRDGALRRVTEDHSVVGILLKRGEITAEEAENHPSRGMLSRFVGMDGLVYPDVNIFDPHSGDRLLLCTDGLTGAVNDDDIRDVLVAQSEPKAACRALVEEANERSGADNITVLVVDLLKLSDESDDGEVRSSGLG